MTIKHTNNYGGTEEQYAIDFPDTNTNDLLRMEISVNGQKFQITEKVINTQAEFFRFQTQLMEVIDKLNLQRLSRFKAA